MGDYKLDGIIICKSDKDDCVIALDYGEYEQLNRRLEVYKWLCEGKDVRIVSVGDTSAVSLICNQQELNDRYLGLFGGTQKG